MCAHTRTHTQLPFHLFTYSSLALSSSSSHTVVNLSANPGSSAFRIPPVFPNFSPRLLLPPGPAPIITSLDLNSPLCPHPPRPVLHTPDAGLSSSAHSPHSSRLTQGKCLSPPHSQQGHASPTLSHPCPYHLPRLLHSSASPSWPELTAPPPLRHLRAFAPAAHSSPTAAPGCLPRFAETSHSHFSPPSLTLYTLL